MPFSTTRRCVQFSFHYYYFYFCLCVWVRLTSTAVQQNQIKYVQLSTRYSEPLNGHIDILWGFDVTKKWMLKNVLVLTLNYPVMWKKNWRRSGTCYKFLSKYLCPSEYFWNSKEHHDPSNSVVSSDVGFFPSSVFMWASMSLGRFYRHCAANLLILQRL